MAEQGTLLNEEEKMKLLEIATRETIGQKISGFRAMTFILTTIVNAVYVWACYMEPKLIQLSGVVMVYDGIAGAVVAGKTYTDIKGKK